MARRGYSPVRPRHSAIFRSVPRWLKWRLVFITVRWFGLSGGQSFLELRGEGLCVPGGSAGERIDLLLNKCAESCYLFGIQGNFGKLGETEVYEIQNGLLADDLPRSTRIQPWIKNWAEDRIERGRDEGLPCRLGSDRHFIEKLFARADLGQDGAQNIDGGCGAEALVGTVSQHTQ